MKKKIVVATDLSLAANAALEFASEQFRIHGSGLDVTLLTVLEDVSAATVTFELGMAPLVSDHTYRELETASLEKLRALAHEFFDGHSIRLEVFRGSKTVATDISEYVRKQGADALIVSTHGRTGIGHFLMGSVAEEIVREWACPTFVVPSRPGAQNRILASTPPRILVLTDFSSESTAIFPLAQEQAAALRGEHPQLILFHIVEDIMAASYHLTLGSDPRAIWTELEGRAEQQMAALRSKFFPDDLVLTTVIRQEGSVGDEIVNFAKARGASLIVLGSHGRKGFQHAMLGSVAERVIRRALCPVLVVPVASGAA